MLRELGRPAAGDLAPQLAVVERWLDDPYRYLLLAQVDDVCVGLASLCIRERLGWSSPEAWLGDLIVRPDVRRRGTARALVSACVDRARARGCRQLRLECGLERGAAQAFYAAVGFERAGWDYRLPLAG